MQELNDNLEKACVYMEKARTELYNAVLKRNREILWQNNVTGQNSTDNFIVLPPDDWKAEYDGEMITLYIPDYMPRTSKRTAGSYERWTDNTKTALWTMPKCPKFDKIFVYVKVFLPNQGWDADNRDVKAVINGIVRAGLIPDDTYEHVAYAVEGRCDETPHTIVHIFAYDMAAKILPMLCN